MHAIPHNKPTLGKEERDAASRALRSGWVAQGSGVRKFEAALSKNIGVPDGHVAAVSSGTASLFLALLALGVAQGDEVIIPSYACSALLNAVEMARAKPVVCDIDPQTLALSFEHARRARTERTRAIIVVHAFGMPADIAAFKQLGVPIIEDCAQAIGARYNGVPVGSTGTISTFSFYATKMITTGYGGAVASEDPELMRKIFDYREFDGRETYEPRFNFQMSDVNASIGLAQLKKLPGFVRRRKAAAREYAKAIGDKAALWPNTSSSSEPNFYRVLVLSSRAAELKDFLAKRGISAVLPIERFELLYRYLQEDPAGFPVSEQVVGEALSIPVYPSLSDAHVRSISKALSDFFKHV